MYRVNRTSNSIRGNDSSLTPAAVTSLGYPCTPNKALAHPQSDKSIDAAFRNAVDGSESYRC